MSADPGSTPNLSNSSNLMAALAMMSPLVQPSPVERLRACMAAGGSIQIGSSARDPGRSSSVRSISKPSAPSMVSEVMSGRWFTPATTGSMRSKPTSKRRLRTKVIPTSSLQSPTARTEVSLVTPRQRAVSGFETFTSHASGATRSTAWAISTTTGTLRSDRMIPPGPTLSPTGWRTP